MVETVTTLTKPGPGVRALIKQVEGESSVGKLHDLSRVISEAVAYEVGTSQSETRAEDAIAEGKGVCQDHAHIFIAAAREMGFPARYVSGYLMMDDRIEQDATHAWAEVYLPGAGWKGFDPTVGAMAGPDHIAVAVARLPESVPPIEGSFVGPPGSTLHVGVWVTECE